MLASAVYDVSARGDIRLVRRTRSAWGARRLAKRLERAHRKCPRGCSSLWHYAIGAQPEPQRPGPPW